MKNIILGVAALATFTLNAQIKTPQLSPLAKFEQTVGLTIINVEYSRPSARGRAIFPEVVAYDELWRTGANKNSMITTSDMLIFGKDTLKAGTYSIFTKPSKTSWAIYFYKTTDNWGTPETWDEAQVALMVKGSVASIAATETFTISIDEVTISGANLSFAWGTTGVKVPFTVNTDSSVEASIKQTLAGPSANDYYRAADYYYNAKKDQKQALEWVNKYIEIKKEETPFYVYRRKALIQAELKDYKGAIETAKKSLEGAKTAGNNDYVKMNEASIAEWSKK